MRRSLARKKSRKSNPACAPDGWAPALGWPGSRGTLRRTRVPIPPHVAAVNSCTAALHVSMVAAGLEAGRRGHHHAADVLRDRQRDHPRRATPVLADVDPRTHEHRPGGDRGRDHPADPRDPAGPLRRPACDMDAHRRLAEAAQPAWSSKTARTPSKPSTTAEGRHFGDFGCFSFYVDQECHHGRGRNDACREDEAHVARIKVLALHGMSKDAWNRFSDDGLQALPGRRGGFKYNMMDLQAAIGIHQLARVEQNWQRRREIWKRYSEAFAELPDRSAGRAGAEHPPRLSPVHGLDRPSALRHRARRVPASA